jgi:bacteriocin-like protein
MSVENVKKFYEAVSQDEALKHKFVELSQKYKGEQRDEAIMISLMKQEALPLAAQMGYSFTLDDVKSYELEMQQAKTGCEMSDEELQAVSGGNVLTDFCLFVGIDAETGERVSGWTTFCFILGFSEEPRK